MQLDPLGQLDLWVIAATIAIATLTYVLLRRWLFGPYVAVLEDRQLRLDDGYERLDQAAVVEQQVRDEVAAIAAEARAAVDTIEHDVLDEVDAHHKRTLDAAIHDVDGLLEQGRREIEAARTQETERVRGQAIDCVALACERLLGKADAFVVESAVDRAIDRLN